MNVKVIVSVLPNVQEVEKLIHIPNAIQKLTNVRLCINVENLLVVVLISVVGVLLIHTMFVVVLYLGLVSQNIVVVLAYVIIKMILKLHVYRIFMMILEILIVQVIKTLNALHIIVVRYSDQYEMVLDMCFNEIRGVLKDWGHLWRDIFQNI